MDAITKELRKLRKKIRQIEHLELVDRELNDEECLKVSKKTSIRKEIKNLLLQIEVDSSSPLVDRNYQANESITQAFSQTNANEEIEAEAYLSESFGEVNQIIEATHLKPSDTQSQTPSIKEENFEDPKGQKIFSSGNAASCDESASDSVPKIPEPSIEPKLTGLEDQQSYKASPILIQAKKTRPQKNKVEPEVNKQKQVVVKRFEEVILSGHSDIVTSVAIGGDVIVSTSRDTTIKVWSLTTGEELNSLRGHTGSVTGVVILSDDAWHELTELLVSCEDFEFSIGKHGAISCSSDCSVKIWDLDSGRLIRSVYTYNGITSVAYDQVRHSSITGTDGGKIEVYDLVSKNSLISANAHSDAVTSVKTVGDKVISASLDTTISVWEWKQNTLNRIFLSENLKTASGSSWIPRPVRGFDYSRSTETLYFGDDGFNLKELVWKTGTLKKLRNHVSEFGMTNAVNITDNVLLTSAYDLDSGRSYINVRSLPDASYKQSILPPDCGRILSLASTTVDSKLIIAIGGSKLSLLREIRDNLSDVISSVVPAFAKDVVDSDEEEEEFEIPSARSSLQQANNGTSPKLVESAPQSSRCVLM